MAIGDVGMFLPSESQYKTPGAYDAMLKGEALKRASYLSSMDQFYEQLEESQRQYDETLEFKVNTRDMELAFAQEGLDLQEREHDLAAELGRGQLQLNQDMFSQQVKEFNRGDSPGFRLPTAEERFPSEALAGRVSEASQFNFFKGQLDKRNALINTAINSGNVDSGSSGNSGSITYGPQEGTPLPDSTWIRF